MIDPRELDRLLCGLATGLPGVVATLSVDDQVVYEGAAGLRALDQPVRMTPDTVIWLASMTKAITAAAAMQLVESGQLSLDGPAADVVPSLARIGVLTGFDAQGQPVLRPPRSPVTLRQLLTHTSGFGYDFLDERTLRYQRVTGTPRFSSGLLKAFEAPMVSDPGEVWQYGIGIDWAGQMIESVTGERLGQYLQQRILGPLRMRDTAFRIGEPQRQRMARIHARGAEGELMVTQTEVRQDAEFDFGGGGLYGTVRDFLRFARMIANRGALDGVRVLQPQTVDLMASNQIGDLQVTPMRAAMPELTHDFELMPGIPKKWGLSFLINTERSAEGRSAGSLAWAGLANSFYWIDPSRRVCGVYATQVLPFCDPAALEGFRAYERTVYRMLDGGGG